MSIVPKPAPPRYACAEEPPSPPASKREPWTFSEMLTLILFIAAIFFLIGIQVGRNAEKEEATQRTITYHEDIG